VTVVAVRGQWERISAQGRLAFPKKSFPSTLVEKSRQQRENTNILF
jgi:hypothetical protein